MLSNQGYTARIFFGQYYFLAQRREQMNKFAEVPVQSLIDYKRQIALHHE